MVSVSISVVYTGTTLYAALKYLSGSREEGGGFFDGIGLGGMWEGGCGGGGVRGRDKREG